MFFCFVFVFLFSFVYFSLSLYVVFKSTKLCVLCVKLKEKAKHWCAHYRTSFSTLLIFYLRLLLLFFCYYCCIATFLSIAHDMIMPQLVWANRDKHIQLWLISPPLSMILWFLLDNFSQSTTSSKRNTKSKLIYF